MFETRYHPGTTAEEVKDDLKNDTRIKDFDICVESVKNKYNTYASFHVTCVCKEDKAKIFFESDLWPPGLPLERRIHSFLFRELMTDLYFESTKVLPPCQPGLLFIPFL